MAVLRMDNVGVVVDDLAAAIAFFVELGLELEGEATLEGPAVDRVVGLHDACSDIAMMVTPDGLSRLELTRFQRPAAIAAGANPVENTIGRLRVMFAVDDLRDTVTRLEAHGAELVGEITRYDDAYLLCYLRGPGGMTVALAEQLG